MNKIYKVIWSKAKNCYVVVSEIAKQNGKCKSALATGFKKIMNYRTLDNAVVALLLAGMIAVPGVANATTMIDGSGTATTGRAIGKDSVAGGKNAIAYGDYSIAFGYGATALVERSVAVGEYATS